MAYCMPKGTKMCSPHKGILAVLIMALLIIHHRVLDFGCTTPSFAELRNIVLTNITKVPKQVTKDHPLEICL